MRLIVSLTLALIATSSFAVEVYRSIAPDGTVVYSDRPSSANSQPVFIATTRGTRSAAPRPTPSGPAASRASDADDAADEAQRPPTAAETAAEMAEIRARNCETARSRAQNYNAAHRLYRTLENGEREYLSDAEIDEARAQAAADVETWCS
ncbi:MAG: DUF4124 domain-containing protein [Gammaproteobacteria bacterium]|nr:DUF4124 domain-containing protein [Gammaproteobacteria bacterium]